MTPDIEIISPQGAPIQLKHSWPTNAKEGIALQKQLARYRNEENNFGEIHTLGGVDIGFEDQGQTTRAAVVLLDAQNLEIIQTHVARIPTRMPYIPGLLSFREVPAAIQALKELEQRPDLLMVDGHGIAHPRRMGVATHLGMVMGRPSIGVAKSRLTGTHPQVPEEPGCWVELTDKKNSNELLGAVLRSRKGVKPIFVSCGYRINLETSVNWVKHALFGYKLPKPTHLADRIASRRREKRQYRKTHI